MAITIAQTAMASPLSPPPIPLSQTELKRLAAHKAVDDFVQSGMVIGLGTGSTAAFAVDRIADLLNQGKLHNIICIPTSKQTQAQATRLGIPLSDLDSHPVVDVAVDGADEVDPKLNLVKGRGGSLLREKMVESACRRFVVIVDETKVVRRLGESGMAVPVEVVRFCWRFTAARLERVFEERGGGCVARLRGSGESGEAFVTDNGNYIVDLYFENNGVGIEDLRKASEGILGVVGGGAWYFCWDGYYCCCGWGAWNHCDEQVVMWEKTRLNFNKANPFFLHKRMYG